MEKVTPRLPPLRVPETPAAKLAFGTTEFERGFAKVNGSGKKVRDALLSTVQYIDIIIAMSPFGNTETRASQFFRSARPVCLGRVTPLFP